jgi:hypothetical protein
MNRNTTPAASTWLRRLHGALTRRMRIERRGFNVRIVAEGTPPMAANRPGPKARRRPDALPPMPGLELAEAHADLKAILDREPDARRKRPTLALLERALDKDCESGIDQIPAAVLRHAAQALDQLQDDCYSPGLVVLRRRVAVVLRRKHASLMLMEASVADDRRPDFSNTLTEFVDLDTLSDSGPRRAPRAN